MAINVGDLVVHTVVTSLQRYQGPGLVVEREDCTGYGPYARFAVFWFKLGCIRYHPEPFWLKKIEIPNE